MKRTKFVVVAAAAAVACVGSLGATAASADPTPAARDLVGVGSDTTQIALNAVADGYASGASWLSGYNAASGARIVSFDAINPKTGEKGDMIKLRVNTAEIARPDGSTAGKEKLRGSTNNTAVSFARSSSKLGSADISAGLVAYPFGVDEVAAGVKAGSSYAPSALSVQQLIKIYNGTYDNWSDVGGANAPITALLPQSGSGTRTFFLDTLKAANGGVDVAIHSSVIQTVQEHDPSVFTNPLYPNAVVPFSVGRAGLVPGQVAFTNTGTPTEGTQPFDAKRPVWNIVRGADASQPWVDELFGTSGYFCSFAATDAIAAGGLTQLTSVDFDGVCGTPFTDGTDIPLEDLVGY